MSCGIFCSEQFNPTRRQAVARPCELLLLWHKARKWLGSARIVLCRKGGAGNETIPTERSRHEGNREEGPIPTNHRAQADSLACLQGFVGTHHGVNERNGLYVK